MAGFLGIALAICHLVAVATAAAADLITLSLSSASVPEGVADPLNPSFAGFGIEPSNLFSFMGNDQPNTLSMNLLNNLKSYTGQPPHIRLGGNTADNMIFAPDMDQWYWIWNPNPVGQGAVKSDSMLIGPRFFEAANRLPQGTPVTWGLNMAYQEPDFLTQLATMATQAITQCPNIKITSFEIGNEPDLYLQNGFRTGVWSGSVYIQQWQQRAAHLFATVLQANGLPASFFEAAATASTIGTSFQIRDLTDAGIAADSGTGAAYLSSWNQHDYYFYIGVSSYGLTLEHLMQLQTTEVQFASWLQQVQQAAQTPFPYALREMGIVGPIGMQGVTDVFGTALWTMNFLLYAASLGISSVQLHMTDNSNASAWQPIELYGRAPFVRPVYYGIVAFDQVIGPSCTAQIQQLAIPATASSAYDGFVKAYAVYQGGQLSSVVVLNGRMANQSVPEAQKPALTVQVQLPAALAGQTMYFSYLTGPGADATEGTTWNGISFEQSGTGIPTTVSSDDVTVQVAGDGSASFPVRDTQVVVGTLGRRIGAALDTDNTAACAAAAANKSPVGAIPGVVATASAAAPSSSSSSSAASSSAASSSTAAWGNADTNPQRSVAGVKFTRPQMSYAVVLVVISLAVTLLLMAL
ncbi:Uu.00g069690.m01.CDS01 [Anthostomella pinea]|uniref:Uu.00g069690.m01.CDS01 n=1 Tax=Anthostomella pinea TaxID=933095 RepID=A0AAI8YNG8_9PEZI|nr:Uu.00g069690.m01.CDS01 [Anthostomella pinea]